MELLAEIHDFFWSYIGLSIALALGVYFSFRARFFQLRSLPSLFRTFTRFLLQKTASDGGIHPLRAFFASVGGMIGIGSVVGIVVAIQLGGPGALFWVWVAALLGSLIKYAEVFLGISYRTPRGDGGFNGGPMYTLQRAFKSKFLPVLVALVLCVYGIEIYQFAVITDTMERNWGINHYLAVSGLLALVFYAIIGGVRRVSKVNSILMPIFMTLYLLMGFWVICNNLGAIPAIFATIVSSAFTGHAAVGGFAGSTMMLAIQHGLCRFAYSADLGVGIDSIIHSESSGTSADKQGRLALLGVFLDATMCSLSMFLVLLTGVWKEAIPASILVQTALSYYFPFMDLFMPIFLTILGYTTIIAYAIIGMKCATFLHPRWGSKIYLVYGASMWVLFSFLDQTDAMIIMGLAQAALWSLNLTGLFKLRKEVLFVTQKKEELSPTL